MPVSINQSGPYNFLLDTGTQVTMVDPRWPLNFIWKPRARPWSQAPDRASASFAQLDRSKPAHTLWPTRRSLVYDLKNLQSADLHIHGILGEDFLEHFDMLIDNAHSMLCLDDTGAMRRR